MSGKGRTRRPSRYNIAQSVFFLLVFLTAAYVLGRSSLFEVREIRVSGNTTLSREKIVSAAGINPGENIFKLDLKSASEKLMVISIVKKVEMSRRLPSTVDIKVEERKPIALLPVETGFIQVDDEGFYMQKGDIGQNQFPVVTGINFDLPSPGGRIVSDKLTTALEFIRGLPPELPPQLSEISVEGDQAIVYTMDGIQCRLGTSAELKKKGEVLLKIIGGIKAKGKRIEYIDLSYAASPVVKYTE